MQEWKKLTESTGFERVSEKSILNRPLTGEIIKMTDNLENTDITTVSEPKIAKFRLFLAKRKWLILAIFILGAILSALGSYEEPVQLFLLSIVFFEAFRWMNFLFLFGLRQVFPKFTKILSICIFYITAFFIVGGIIYSLYNCSGLISIFTPSTPSLLDLISSCLVGVGGGFPCIWGILYSALIISAMPVNASKQAQPKQTQPAVVSESNGIEQSEPTKKARLKKINFEKLQNIGILMFLPLVLTSLLFLLMAAFITSTDSFKLLLAGLIALIILYIAALAVLPICMAIEAPSQIFAATVVAKVILIPFYVFQIKTILHSSGLILGGIIFPIALTQSIYGTLIVIFLIASGVLSFLLTSLYLSAGICRVRELSKTKRLFYIVCSWFLILDVITALIVLCKYGKKTVFRNIVLALVFLPFGFFVLKNIFFIFYCLFKGKLYFYL